MGREKEGGTERKEREREKRKKEGKIITNMYWEK